MDELSIYRQAFRVLAADDLLGAARACLEALVEATGADRGFLLLVDANGVALGGMPFASHLARRTRLDAREQPSSAVVARALATGRPVRLENALEEPDFRGRPSVLRVSVLSVLAVPIATESGPLAVAYLDSARVAGIFSAEAEATAEALAQAMAPALASARRANEAERCVQELAAERASAPWTSRPIGESPAFVAALDLAKQVAPSDVGVLLVGETGTGKEVFARVIHAHSRRAKAPFVAINCAALPSGTIEAELFGYTRGAFTGATEDRTGLVEAAHGGTFFLDEVGDLPLPLQAKLLRFLQDGEVRRLGAPRAHRVDVRVIAATHRNLDAMLADGCFREDLYYRLRGVEVRIPALRERGDDVLLLASTFVRQFATLEGRPIEGLTAGATAALSANPFPGNVRELESTIRSAVLLGTGTRLRVRDLPSTITSANAPATARSVPDGTGADPAGRPVRSAPPQNAAELKAAKRQAAEALERAFLVDLLERTAGKVTLAAELAGMQRTVLHDLLGRHGIEARAFRKRSPTKKA